MLWIVRPSPRYLLALARPAAPALAVFASKDTGSAGRLMTSFYKKPATMPAFFVQWRKFTPCTPSRGICGAHVGIGHLRRLVKRGIMKFLQNSIHTYLPQKHL